MYPDPLKVAIRKLSDDIVIVSCPFKLASYFNLGNRMSIINCNGKAVVHSTIPYGEYFEEALALSGATEVGYIVVVNLEHNLAVKDYAARFPDAKIITGEGLSEKKEWKADYVLNELFGNRILTAEVLNDELQLSWPESLQILYLLHHKNREIVLFHPSSGTMFEGDLIVSMGNSGPDGLELYSPATGFPEKFNALSGWSYLFRAVHTQSFLGHTIYQKLSRANTPGGREGLKLIDDSWDIRTIVPCHGNVITTDAKQEFKNSFPSVFN